MPTFLGGLCELEDHGESGLVRKASLRSNRSMPNGRERALDRVCRAQMFPVLGRKVVEGEQWSTILAQALDSLLVLDAIGFDEPIECSLGVRPGLRHPDVLQCTAFACRLFGSLFKTFAVLCTQQRCARVFGHTSSIAFQNPSAPSATASCGAIVRPRRLRSRRNSFQDCALSRIPSERPTSSFLPSAVAPMITSRHCASSSSRAWM